jgi:hypothetical protein
MVKLKGVVVLHSHLVLYRNLMCIVLVFVGCESDHRNQKRRIDSAEVIGRHEQCKQPSRFEGNSFRTLKTNRGQQTAHEVPLLQFCRDEWKWMSKSTPMV